MRLNARNSLCLISKRSAVYTPPTHTHTLSLLLSFFLSFYRPPVNLFYCVLLILAEKLYSHLAFAVKINKTNSVTPSPSDSPSPFSSPSPPSAPSPSSTGTSGKSLCSFSTGVCWLFCLFCFDYASCSRGSRGRRRRDGDGAGAVAGEAELALSNLQCK